MAYGAWAYIKNHPDGRGHGWELEWIGALPGKRENVRYVGAHVLTQNDLTERVKFPDIIGHGSWTMDDHPPGAWDHPGEPTDHYGAPSPYGIPYRSLYSRNIANLSFAGRNISATHMAMSSTRVMATCAVMGQAAGTGAALAISHNCDPQQVHDQHLPVLQQQLSDQDQWLPTYHRAMPALHDGATITASDPENTDASMLWNGYDRRLGKNQNAWIGARAATSILRSQKHLTLTIYESLRIAICVIPNVCPVRILSAGIMPLSYYMIRDMDISVQQPDGSWEIIAQIRDNYRRLISIPINCSSQNIRITLLRAWGDDSDKPVRLFSIEVHGEQSAPGLISNDWPEDLGRRNGGSA